MIERDSRSARVPTREECIREAGEIFASMFDDPADAAAIHAHMAKWDAEHPEATNVDRPAGVDGGS